MLLRIAWELDSFAIAQNSSPGNFEKLPYPLKTLTPGGEKAAQLSCVQFLLGGAFQKKLQKKPNLKTAKKTRYFPPPCTLQWRWAPQKGTRFRAVPGCVLHPMPQRHCLG